MDEAMNFVITAGAVAPMRPVNYSPPKNLAGELQNAQEVLDRPV
jgi:hypothetical protein